MDNMRSHVRVERVNPNAEQSMLNMSEKPPSSDTLIPYFPSFFSLTLGRYLCIKPSTLLSTALVVSQTRPLIYDCGHLVWLMQVRIHDCCTCILSLWQLIYSVLDSLE